jgi:hypothetical protein
MVSYSSRKAETPPQMAVQDANPYIEHALLWLALAVGALGIYVAVSDLL